MICLLPLVGILAREAPRLAQAPLILGYGMAVLSGTIAMLFIAYARYDDPSERTLLRPPARYRGFPGPWGVARASASWWRSRTRP